MKRSPSNSSVTLVTHLSFERAHNAVPMLASRWSGPASLALYATDAEAVTLVEGEGAATKALRARPDIEIHLVFKNQVELLLLLF